jgi:hypothetical protein
MVCDLWLRLRDHQGTAIASNEVSRIFGIASVLHGRHRNFRKHGRAADCGPKPLRRALGESSGIDLDICERDLRRQAPSFVGPEAQREAVRDYRPWRHADCIARHLSLPSSIGLLATWLFVGISAMRHCHVTVRCTKVIFALLVISPIALAQPRFPVRQEISDLSAHTTEAPAIHSMVTQGIMRTVRTAKFEPDAPTTRGELALSLQHMFNLGRPAKPVEFADIPASSPLYSSVQAVAPFLGRQILCFGCALSLNFLPDEPVSPIEGAVLLTNILLAHKKFNLLSRAEAEPVLATLEDANVLKGPLRIYVATAIRNDVLTLSAPGQLKPNTQYSRAQTAVTLDRVQRKFMFPPVSPR